MSFGARPEDVEPLRARLKRNDVAQQDSPEGFESNGVWFRDPDESLVEMRVAGKSSPNEKAVQSNPPSPPGVRGSHARSKAPVVRPRRLAHTLLFRSDVAAPSSAAAVCSARGYPSGPATGWRSCTAPTAAAAT